MLAVKHLVILHCLLTDGLSQLKIPVVQYTGTWSKLPKLLFKPSFIVTYFTPHVPRLAEALQASPTSLRLHRFFTFDAHLISKSVGTVVNDIWLWSNKADGQIYRASPIFFRYIYIYSDLIREMFPN